MAGGWLRGTRRWTLVSRHSILAKSLTAKSFFNHNQAPGQVCGRLPQGSLKGEGVGTTESNDSDLHGWAEIRRAVLGRAKLALCFSNPFTSELARDSEIHRPLCYANGPAILRQKSLRENAGLRLASKWGCVVKKHLQARLRVSFQQQIQHSHSESTPCFLSSYPCISW